MICNCIVIRDSPVGNDVMVMLADGIYGCRLPNVEAEDKWIAHQPLELRELILEKYGVPVFMLGPITENQPAAVAFALQGTDPPPLRPALRMVSIKTVLQSGVLSPEHSELLQRWVDCSNRNCPPWSKPDWHIAACEWISSALEDLCIRQTGPSQQFKVCDHSCIITVPTESGRMFFKAVNPNLQDEPSIIRELASNYPSNVPNILCVKDTGPWMLMKDFGTGDLDTKPFTYWQRAVRKFGNLQRDVSSQVDNVYSRYCPRRTGEQVLEIASTIASPHSGNVIGRVISSEEADLLASKLPELRVAWAKLESLNLPLTLVQQDFRHANIVYHERNYVFYDWSDVAIAHPFFSLTRFLSFMPSSGAASDIGLFEGLNISKRKERVICAYIQAWTGLHKTEDLLAAFALAMYVDPIFQAVRWYTQIPSAAPTSVWGTNLRKSLAYQVRRQLERLNSKYRPALA